MSTTMTATVVAIENCEQYTDDMPRVTLRIDEADYMFNRIRLKFPADELPELGQTFALVRCTPSELDVLLEGLSAIKG